MEENLPPDQSFTDLRAESLSPSNEGGGSSLYQSGQTIGDFRLVRFLGEGGMGTVWEAVQESLGRKVALKMLSPQVTFSPKALARFQREAEAGARLSHSSIVTVHAIGEAEGIHYIAQELIKGGSTLADTVETMRKRDVVPEDYYGRIAGLFAQVAEGLHLAHSEGIIHRDLKPQNILMAEDGRPLVADFGLAQIEDALELSQTGDFAGTPYYMSPEQAMSKRMGIDHRTDIFSLGATFYECLAMGRPFEGDSSHQVLKKIVLEDPPDPRKVRSRVPRELVVICQKTMEKRPEDRYQSMEELAAELNRFLNDEPILAKPPGIRTRFKKWRRRHPVITISSYVGGLFLLLLVAAVYDMIEATKAETRKAKYQDEALRSALSLAAYADKNLTNEEQAAEILNRGLELVENRTREDLEFGTLMALSVANQLQFHHPSGSPPWLEIYKSWIDGEKRNYESTNHDGETTFAKELASFYSDSGDPKIASKILYHYLHHHSEHPHSTDFPEIVEQLAEAIADGGDASLAESIRESSFVTIEAFKPGTLAGSNVQAVLELLENHQE